MTDFYTEFNITAKLPEAAINWAIELDKYIQGLRNDLDVKPPEGSGVAEAAQVLQDSETGEYCLDCDIEKIDGGLYISSNGNSDETSAAEFVQAILRQFKLDCCIKFQIAYTCSKPIPDAFGGSACVITRKEIAWFNIGEWLANKEKELLVNLGKI